MSLTLVTRPTVYPVTLAEAKDNANLEHDDDDAFIVRLIAMATEYAEIRTGRDLVQRTWDYSFDTFPSGDIALPKYPVLSVTSVTYTDISTSPQLNTVASTVYGLDSGGHRAILYLKYNQEWPTHTVLHNSITVRFISGYEGLGSPQDLRGNIPEVTKGAILMLVSDAYNNRDAKSDIQLYPNDTVNMMLDARRFFRL